MDGLSLHYYTLPTGDWKHKGSATDFGEDQWHSTLARTLHMEELLTKHSAIMDKHDPRKRVGLVVDEWGTWYDPAPRDTSAGKPGGILYQQNTLRDALVAAINLNMFHAHCDRVSMCNIAQLANVLQAMVLTDKEKMVLTPTYHVMRMYKVHQGATFLPVDVQTPPYTFGDDARVPGVHASASRDGEGRLHLSIANLDPNRPAALSVKVSGASPATATGSILTAEKMNAMNTFDAPESVKPAPLPDLRLADGVLSFTAPAKSVMVIEMK